MVAYARLKKINKLLWKNDDLLSQEDLFEAQEEMAKLLLDVAKSEHKEEDLIKSF